MNRSPTNFLSFCGRRPRAAMAAVAVAVVLGGCQTTGGGRAERSDVYEPLYHTAIMAERNADYMAAAGHYDKLTRHRPDDLDILLGLSRNLRYAGHPGQALQVLERQIKTHGLESRFQFELGKARIAAGQPDAAIGHLEAAAVKEPNNWEIFSALGIARDLSEDFAKAQAAYDKALGLSKDNPAVLNNKAISLASQGRLDDAISTLTDAGVAARRSPELRQTLALLYGIRGNSVQARSLARIDLSEESIQQNLDVYARIRQ